MSKEAFAPLWNAERGVFIDWATFLFERLQIAEIRDKRRSPSLSKLVPYLGGIFSYVLQVPVGLGIAHVDKANKRKLEYKSPLSSKMKPSNRITWVTPECSETAAQSGVSKSIVFPSVPKVSQAVNKAKVFTFNPSKVEDKFEAMKQYPANVKPLQSQNWAHVNLAGIFNAQEAVNSLSELGRFINNQEAMLRSLEGGKAKTEQVGLLAKQVQDLEDLLAVANKEKAYLQQALSEANLQLNVKMDEVLQSALEFGGWADGLKISVDVQFKSFGDRMVQLISDNNFLMNRLTLLMNMEKTTLEGQSITGVLVA